MTSLDPPLVEGNQSRPGMAVDPSSSPSPENSPSHVYPAENPHPRYKDAELRQPRDSHNHNDIELGNVPLLPAGLEYEERESSEWDFSVDRHRFTHDPPLSCTATGFIAWLRGPTPPHVYHIHPWFPRWQAAPSQLVDRWAPSRIRKIALLAAALLFWIVVFFSTLKSFTASQAVPGYGQPARLSCHHRLWNNATDCGLNGDLCRPFDEQSFAFRCPSGCAAAMILEPYNLGAEEVNYRPLVIGGKPFKTDGRNSGIYRGDSSICASALHAGLIDDEKGGCAILHRKGERDRFQSFAQNGIESIEFLSHFPMSFLLTREASSSKSGEAKLVECSDIRWSLFAFTLVFTALLSMTITSTPVFYSVIFFIVWFQVAMASDPPTSGYSNLVSMGLGRFLPGAFVGFTLYYFCIRQTFRDFEAHLDKTVLWLGGCWVGALNTDTFDRIPISRLTPHDLQQQPGAIPALLIIVGFLISVTFLQAYGFRREGRFFSQLRVYGVLVLGMLILVAVPHMNLRIHHYILSLLLLPGTTLQTRPSLLFQGLLIGLFINGIARWGFDSILQTPASLLDGGRLGTTPPKIDAPVITGHSNMSIKFPTLPPEVDGLSVLVNDVERYRELKPKSGNSSLVDFEWQRRFQETEYFRFGYLHLHALGGIWFEDFSKASTWHEDGTFTNPESE